MCILNLKVPGWLSDLNVLLTRKLLSVPMLLLYLNEISGAGRKWCCNGKQNGT